MRKIILIALLCLSICMPAHAALTFLADFTDDSLTSDYSKGSGTATLIKY